MKINCAICHRHCGDIKEGSKLLKGLKHLCNECFNGVTRAIVDDNRHQLPDFLRGFMRGKS